MKFVFVCLFAFEGATESKRETAEISIKGEDYPVKRLPATRSFSPPLTPSLPHPLSHHPQYWRGLSEQVIRGEPTELTHTQCLNNLLRSGLLFSFSCLLCKYFRIFFLRLFCNFPSCHFFCLSTFLSIFSFVVMKCFCTTWSLHGGARWLVCICF